MLPGVRSLSVLVLGLAANRADGEPRAYAAPATVTASSASAVTESALDRNVSTLLGTGPFLPYTQEASLDSEACAAMDKGEQLRGRIESAVLRTASEQLNLPMGSGRLLDVNGRRYLFCLEPHYREPGAGRGPVGWHKGVTVYAVSASPAPRRAI